MAKIAEITRTYGGLEGRRVKIGTRFAIGSAVEGLVTITTARFTQLKDAGLAREYDPAAKPGTVQPAYMAARQIVQQRQPIESRTARKARLKNAGAPAEPRPLTNPAIGGLSSTVKLAASSPEAQASVVSNLGLRGRRKSSPSPSMTPTVSPPGPALSTPATAPGGATTTESQNS